jgi:NADH:ubiquinone oxidoreductase subunit E
MSGKLTIALCMGSSCFARGNQAVLETLEDMIADNGWADRIHLSGLRCENKCSEGPNIKIDGHLYQGLDTGALMDLIAQKLGVEPAAAKANTSISTVRRPGNSRRGA